MYTALKQGGTRRQGMSARGVQMYGERARDAVNEVTQSF